jgi:transcriptional regulator GlxA family with amidase domain
MQPGDPVSSDDTPLAAGILLFDEVEVLDFCGPFEVFSSAARIPTERTPPEPPLFRVFTLAERTGLISARGGLRVQPDYTLAEHPPIDLLLVPGGQGTRTEVHNAALIAWIEQTATRSRLVTSVCTGAFLLARAGLLAGHAATTHWASLDRLAETHPDVTVRSGVRWVDEGRIVTSAGISAGIDVSLHLVERLAGRALAVETARRMEYTWTPSEAAPA